MPNVIRRAAERFGDDDFIVMPDRRISFRDAEAASRHLAKQLLAAGVGKGTRVGLQLPTGPEWAVAWIALGRVGALAMPFSTIYRAAELRSALRVGDVDLLLASTTMLGKDHESYLEEAIPGLAGARGDVALRSPQVPYLRAVWLLGAATREWSHGFDTDAIGADDAIDGVDDALLAAIEAEVTPADLLVAIFTSGTTAAPKAVLHTHGAVLRKTAPESGAGLNASFPGRVLSFMPFFWVGGLQSVAGALQSGAAVLTVERLEPSEALALAQREQATSIQGNAATLRTLMGNNDAAIDSLRPLPQRSWEPDPASRGDAQHALGMTETVGVWASVGGFDVRVVDPESGDDVVPGAEGEFHVRGYSLMQGLYKREREDVFTPDGYYRTGDLGHIEAGFVHFHARLGDMIKTKGANVAPAEVESVLNDATGVRVSFVVGLDHDVHGQLVGAAVIAEAGHTIDVEALLRDARRVLSPYKVPSVVEVIDDGEIPWLPSGKPNRRALAELLVARRASA